MVFNMIEHNLLAKTENDSRDDFKDGYDFVETFKNHSFPAAPVRAISSRFPDSFPLLAMDASAWDAFI